MKDSQKITEKINLFREIAEKCIGIERIREIASEFSPEDEMDSFKPIKELKIDTVGKNCSS